MGNTLNILNRWLSDPFLRRLLKNSSVLFSGNVAASLLGLASLAITARALGVEQFGMLVLITTYVLIVDRLINFQTWQALIKFGADALENRYQESFKSLIKFGFMLDSATAVVAASVAAGSAWMVGGWLGWSEDHILMAVAYSATILFHISGTPIAILRLYGQFKKTAVQEVLAATIKIAGVLMAYFMGAGLWAFLLVWALTDILGKVILIWFAHKELIERKVRGVFQAKASDVSVRYRGIWGFVWVTNFHGSVKLGLREADIIIIGLLIGPSGAGVYKLVKTVGSVIGKGSDPLYQAIYPDLVRLFGSGQYKQFKKLIYMPMTLLFAVSVFSIGVFYVVGEGAIDLLVGPSYVDAYWPALTYLMGTMIATITFPLHPAMLSSGMARLSLNILVASTIIYLILLYILTVRIGLVGAALAYVIFYVTWASMQLFAVAKIVKKEVLYGER